MKIISDQEIHSAARTIWDYLQIDMPLQKADGILIFCSNDLRVAEHAANLYHQQWAPWICTSGGVGRLTYDLYHKPEAEAFAEVLINRGVPESAILIENQATNTAENIFFTRQILTKAHLHPESLIVLQKPYMGRRTFAALTQYWPEMKVIISSPPIAFEDYPFPGFSMEELINVLVGDFQRIHLYAERGWQAPQIIPRVVWDAYYLLISESYTKQLADPDSPPSIE